MADIVARIEAADPIGAVEARILAGGGSPLGGAKPKALIDIDGEPWVVKFDHHEPVDAPLVDDTDDHEKNHALRVVDPHGHGRLRLAPAYDVLPTGSGQGFQAFVCGDQGRESTLDDALPQCEAFGLTPPEAAREVAAVVAVVDTWRAHFARAGVSPHDIEQLAERIDGEPLRAQREAFDVGRHPTAPSRTKRRGPFRDG